MITNRLNGLLNLHTMVLAFVVPASLFTYAYIVRHFESGVDLLPVVNIFPYCLAASAAILAGMNFIHAQAPNYHRFTRVDAARLTLRQVLVVMLFYFALMVAIKEQEMSRTFTGSYFVILSGLLLFLNAGLPRILSRIVFQGQHQLPSLFIGNRASLGRMSEWLESKQALGLKPVGFLTNEYPGNVSPNDPVRLLGPLAYLSKAIERHLVAQIIVLDVPKDPEELRNIANICQENGCRLLVYNNLAETLKHPVVTLAEEGHNFFSLRPEPLESPLNLLIKRVLDIIVALSVVLLILPPLMVIVWVMQRLQAPGPLFHVQNRAGRDRRHFPMLKFRSMYLSKSEKQNEAKQACKNDARIFLFGYFLRRSSLDEFPQFVNVLKGEMSIVGPRPHLQQHDEEFAFYARGYRTRFLVKPGITGLAQCHGFRGEITEKRMIRERVRYDIEYIMRWSIWLDVQIIFRTAWQMIFPPKSAY